jgi:hypothetical protein
VAGNDCQSTISLFRLITVANLGSRRISRAAANSRGVFRANHSRRGRQSIITAA